MRKWFPFPEQVHPKSCTGTEEGQERETVCVEELGACLEETDDKKGFPRDSRENDYIHRLAATSKYTENLGSQASQCQRRELEIWGEN